MDYPIHIDTRSMEKTIFLLWGCRSFFIPYILIQEIGNSPFSFKGLQVNFYEMMYFLPSPAVFRRILGGPGT